MSIAYLEDPSLPKSYYEAIVGTRPNYASLEQDISCDVCIVGAGLAGLQAANGMVNHGLDVVVLEANQVGWGASGRNGGQVIPEFACGMHYLESALGLAEAQLSYALLRDATALIRRQVVEFDIDCDYQAGHLETAVTPQHAKPLKAWCAHASKHYNGGQRFVPRDELSQFIGSKRYYGGILDMEAGHLDPLRYTLGLARAFVSRGGRLFERSGVSSWQDGKPVRVVTRNASVSARAMVVANSVGIESMQQPDARRLSRRILPVGTWIVATKPLSPTLANELLPTRLAVADNRAGLDYFRLSADNRLIFGGGASYLGDSSPDGHTEELLRNMLATFPQLENVGVDFVWGGLMDMTLSRAPSLGRIQPNIYHLHGFGGSGLVATAVAGRIAAEAVVGNDHNLRIMERLSHRNFPGGKLLRGPIVSIGKTWIRARDRMRIWGLGR